MVENGDVAFYTKNHTLILNAFYNENFTDIFNNNF